MLLIIFQIFRVLSLGLDSLGTVWPTGSLPISNSYTNAKTTADYTFTFYTDHSLSVSNQISIKFPLQFVSGLGITLCKASLGPCSVFQYTVTTTLLSPLYKAQTYTLTIYGISNPLTEGGTGSFIINTWIGQNLIDSNNIFGVAGISQPIGSLLSAAVNIVQDDSSLAGQLARYEFKFRLYRTLGAGNWIRFSFPMNGFGFAKNPTCSSFLIAGYSLKGSLLCTSLNNQVTLQGISEDVPSNTHVGVRISVKNPVVSVFTSSFTIETGKNSTFTVYDGIYGISGVVIGPGQISKISLTPVNSTIILSTLKPVLYRLQFLISNHVPLGGFINIVCTSSFVMNGIYYIEYGLNDVSFTQTVQMSYNSGTFTLVISNFASLSPGVVSILMFLVNPGTSGVTDPLIIRTLMPDGLTIIDENLRDAVVYISDLTAPGSASVTFPSGSQATGSSINLKLSFTPNYEIPALGWVSFLVPYGFTGMNYYQTCYVKPTNELEQSATSCYYSNNMVYIQLFADSAGIFGKFEAGISSYIRITSLMAPTLSGTYIFDFSTYTPTNIVIETGTATGQITASTLVTSFDVVHSGINTPTIIKIQFSPSKTIPSGKTPSVSTDLTGNLEIQLSTWSGSSNLFATNLGLVSTEVPCLGISGIDQFLTCTITAQPSVPSTPVYVTISNFSEIQAGSVVVIHLAGITYVGSGNSPLITLTTYQNNNRVRYNLESGSQFTNIGLVMPGVTNSGSSLTLSDKTVLHSTTLSTGTSFSTNSASGAVLAYILIHIYQSHDKGYCYSASISCYLDSVLYPCVCYPIADMILISLTGSYPSGLHTMQIIGLVNPESVPVANDDLKFYIIGNHQIVQYLTFTGRIPLLLPGGFITTHIIPSDLGQGYVFVSYSIVLQPNDYIPTGGSIQIIFPVEYSLSSSSPKPTCSTNYPHPISSSVSCSLFSNTFTLSSFSTINAGYVVVIFIKGVKNPSVSFSSNFVINTLNSAGRIIDQNLLAGTISFSNLWQTETIQYLQISVYPSNANSTGEYSFTFTPSPYLGSGGVIQISFPITQFGLLPSSPSCRLSGQVITIATCVSSASALIITTNGNAEYKSLTVSLQGLINFDQGNSNDFVITTTYDGVVLQTTGTGTSQLVAQTTAQGNTLKVSNILFYPTNEGEISTYEFYFSPVTTISTAQYIVVKFPSEFDHRVGDVLECSATGLTGYLNCYVLHAYTVFVTNFDAYSCASCEIVLSIAGVINPIQGNTGQFLIGILDDSLYTEANEYSGFVTINSAPNYLEIIHTVTENSYSRYSQTFMFNITCNQTIPTTVNGGKISVWFPEEYLLTDSYITCRSSSFWASGVPQCHVNYSQITITGQTQEYSGNFLLYLDNVPNPLTDVFAGFIIVEAYDGFNRKVLSRSYPNLDPNRYQFLYPGPLIQINNGNSFSVRRGTVSSFIPITLDYPCALNLTLVPTSNSFLFVPDQISLKVGDTSNEFRVSIPYDTEDREYVITWRILGETSPIFYTPIQKSLFYVYKNETLSIEIDSITPVPIGFSSMPVYIILPGGPNSDITLHLSLPGSVSGIQLSSSTILFGSGEYTKSFTIAVSNNVNVNSSYILFSISGTNAEAYVLTNPKIPFDIFSDSSSPEVLGAGVIMTTRTSALITVTFNKFCWCYYAYALKGTQVPSFSETASQGPATYATTNTKYGVIQVKDSTIQVLNLTSLTAQTRYRIFFWAEDLSGTISSSYQQLDFDTDDIYNSAQVALRFKQIYLNDVEIANVKNLLELYLSAEYWRIIINIRNTDQANSARIYSAKATWPIVSFFITDDPSSSVYPSPVVMTSRLSLFEYRFENQLSNFDSSYSIIGSEVVVNDCSFVEYPNVVHQKSNYETISLSAKLEEDGFIYAVALVADSDPGVPYSFQVFHGTDAWNRPTISVNTAAFEYTIANFSFLQLNQNTSYVIYVICGNNNPGFPQLLKDSSIVKIEWTTGLKPQPIPFSIDLSMLVFPILFLYSL